MMGNKRDKRGKQDIGETYATYWIRKHQDEMCRYQPIVRENSMVTLRTNQIPDRSFIREGSLMNLKSSPRKNNEFNFARDLSMSGEPNFFRDRESAFFRDPPPYYDRHASCHGSEISLNGDSMAKESSHNTGTAFLPEKSRRLFERWENHQDNPIPQRKYTILPQIGNPRFISIQDTRHQFVNQLDYSRDNFEKDADFFADYNKSFYHEEVRSVRGLPLPPLNSVPPRLKLNIMYQPEEDISEETSRCFTNSITLSDNLATSTLDEFSDEDSTITSAHAECTQSEDEEKVASPKHKESSSESESSEEDSSCIIEGKNIGWEKEPEKKESDKENDKKMEVAQVQIVKCVERPVEINVVESQKETKEKPTFTKKAVIVTSQNTKSFKIFKNIRKFKR